MGFIENKSGIFKSVGIGKALTNDILSKFRGSKNKLLSSFDSIKSKSRNIIPFLLDLIKTLDGVKKIEDIFDEIIRSLDEVEKEIKSALYEVLKNIYTCNFDGTIPTWLTDGSFQITPKTIDPLNLFRVNPTTPVGVMLYDNNLNSFLFDVLQGSAGVWSSLVYFEYLPNGKIQIRVQNPNQTIDEFLKTYLNSLVLFPKENIFAKFMDNLFGKISDLADFTKDDIEAELKVQRIIDNMLDADEDPLKIINDDSYFFFDMNTLREIEEQADMKARGVNVVNMSCGLVEVSITEEELINSVANITGSTELIVIKEEILLLTNNAINRSTINDEDKKTSRDFFIVEFLTSLPKIFMSILLSPKIILLLIIMHRLTTTIVSELDAIELIKAHKQTFIKLAKKVLAPVVKRMFKVVLKSVSSLTGQITSSMVLEKLNLFKVSLLSLTGGVTDKLDNAFNKLNV